MTRMVVQVTDTRFLFQAGLGFLARNPFLHVANAEAETEKCRQRGETDGKDLQHNRAIVREKLS